MSVLNITDLTTGTVGGTGVFDKLIEATKAHLDAEYTKSRIRGPEYSQVYLGSLQSILDTSVRFLLQKNKNDLEEQILAQQLLLAQVEVQKATIQLELLGKEKDKIDADILLVNAQVNLAEQQLLNLQKDTDKTDAEITHLGAQTALVTQQKTNLVTENTKTNTEISHITAQTAMTTQQTANLVEEKAKTVAEVAQVTAQTAMLTQQKLNLAEDLKKTTAEISAVTAQAALTTQNTANAVVEKTVLVAQECKLRAEYDLIVSNTSKSGTETLLLAQKVATEKAQTQSTGVDPDSVVGKQKALYAAQTAGFDRDAEQKAAKIMIDTWNVRRTTDEGTVADEVNKLNDSAIGRAVAKLLSGVGA